MKGIQVEIDGMNFYVLGSSDEKRLKEMAQDLTRRIQETAASNFRLNQVQGLVLTSLNLMDELYQAREETKDLTANDPKLENLRLLQEENRKLEGQVAQAKEDRKDWHKKWESLNEDRQSLEARLKKLDGEKASLEKEKQGLVDQGRSLEQKIKELEDKVYEDQMTLVDLQKEISILNGSEED